MASRTHKEEEYFPVKLFRMVEDKAYSEIIWWNEDGDGFFICEDQEEFLTSKILENYNFKTNSYGSFIRQLNNYGFHKKRRPNQEKANEPSSYYCHDKGYFKRSSSDFLMNITKTKGNQGTKKETFLKKETGQKLNEQVTNQDLLQSIKKTETDTSFENVTSGSFPGIHVGMSDQTQTQITDILDMVMQSGQYMRDELRYDVGGEATSEKTIPQTETSLIPDVRFPEFTLAPSVGGFDTRPFQLGDVPVPFMQQASKGSSLPGSLHEPETCEQHLIDQYPLQDWDFPPLFTTELQNEVVVNTGQGSEMSETGYSSEENLNQPKELGQEIAVATNVTQDPFRLYQADGNAYSSDEGSSSKEQTVDVTINPESCRPEGGKCFWLEFDKSLPSSVTSAWAAFGPYGQVKIRTYDEDCTMFGKKIPPGRPGIVTVTVTTETGECLGKTVFTYKNSKKKGNNQGLSNKRRLDELSAIVKDFAKKLKQFQQGDDGDESLKSAFKQGPLHQEKQLEPEKFLKALVYAAAEAGAMRPIETIFSLPAGRVVFESYKEESSLPEDIAEENGHGKVAAYLRVKTKRYSEEQRIIPVQLRTIEFDWLKLANALEELEPSQSVTESSSDQDLNQIWEDYITGTGYSADGETSSSGSGKEISDSDDEVHKMGAFKGTLPDPRNEEVTELLLSDISDDVGTCWRVVGSNLLISKSKIHNLDDEYKTNRDKANALLISWKQQEGSNATVGHLADVLVSVGKRSIAERLLELSCINQRLRGVDTEESNVPYQVSKMEAKIKALQVELSEESQKLQDKEQEVSQLITRIEGLEKELSIANQKSHDEINEQQGGDLATDTDQLAGDREHRIDVRLRNINEQLHIYVTSPLQVQEVKQDQLKTAVKLDLLTKLSERLQEVYKEALGMVKEACKCSEDLRKEFYDLVYHGLRAEHKELVHRVKDLKSSQEEMSQEEKKEFDKLQSYQRDRQSQVDQLDKLWRYFFTPPGRRQKTAMSADPMGQNKPRDSKKVTRYTDPGDIWRKLKLRGEDTRPAAPSTSSYGQPEEESRLTLRKMKSTVGSVIQTISKKKEGGEKQMRDC